MADRYISYLISSQFVKKNSRIVFKTHFHKNLINFNTIFNSRSMHLQNKKNIISPFGKQRNSEIQHFTPEEKNVRTVTNYLSYFPLNEIKVMEK